MHWVFFAHGMKFRWGSESLDIDESPSSLLILKKKDIECAFGYYLFCWKLKTENNKKSFSSYLFTFKITVHMPICTVHVPWIVQEAPSLKKKKNKNANAGESKQSCLQFKEKKKGARVN